MRNTTRSVVTAALAGAVVLGTAASATARPTLHVTKSGFGDVTVNCPYGFHAIGGGVDIDHDDEVTVFRSRPTKDGYGWEGSAWGEVDAHGDSNEPQGLPVTVYAVCFLD
ncbi:hypothetical protein V1J52_12175 [Streptomyces sp. TRM 70351]|uniref:hypothetical protein n=1 Tax=Streptomyces sp. TRM 70351 TaxID=3116552 RepID=UPI002E7AEB25|nr:hypothetical protein [Streptomyces sp. TRM 70351]MEE1928923.1 hypothetical protein [Streptomyces sp. TRM 70351]